MIRHAVFAVLVIGGCSAAQETRFDATLAKAARYCMRAEAATPLLKPALVVSGVPADIVAQGDTKIAAYCQAIQAVAVPVK
jgi:hypothetical protein